MGDNAVTVGWKKYQPGTYFWQSDAPRGYYIARVNFLEVVHMVASFERPDGGPEHVGQFRDIPKKDIESQKVALAQLRKMCGQHATKRLNGE